MVHVFDESHPSLSRRRHSGQWGGYTARRASSLCGKATAQCWYESKHVEIDDWSTLGLRDYPHGLYRFERLLCIRGAWLFSLSDTRDVCFDACGVLSYWSVPPSARARRVSIDPFLTVELDVPLWERQTVCQFSMYSWCTHATCVCRNTHTQMRTCCILSFVHVVRTFQCVRSGNNEARYVRCERTSFHSPRTPATHTLSSRLFGCLEQCIHSGVPHW